MQSQDELYVHEMHPMLTAWACLKETVLRHLVQECHSCVMRTYSSLAAVQSMTFWRGEKATNLAVHVADLRMHGIGAIGPDIKGIARVI